MLQLLIREGLLEGAHAIGPSTAAAWGVRGVLFDLGLAKDPAPVDSRCGQPIHAR
jgi:hypothetical protein